MSDRLNKEEITRRDFLGKAGLWVSAAAVGGSVVGMARLPKPRVLPEEGSLVRAGKPEQFPPGTRQLLPEHNVLVVATTQGIAAVSLICTHLGCIVGQTPDGFSCPCHGSKFDARGNVLSGPAPSGLHWLEVALAANGYIMVDRKSRVEPGTFFRA